MAMCRQIAVKSKFSISRCLTSKKKGVFISCVMELLVWAFLLCLAIYIYYPESFQIFFANTTSKPSVRDIVFQAKPQDSALVYRLELTMQIVLGRGKDIDAVLVDGLRTKQFVVPADLRKSPTNSTSEKFPQANIIDPRNKSTSFLDKYIKSVQIICSAPFPIEFAYEGSGSPIFGEIRVEKRNVKVLGEMTQYFYIANLDFEKYLLEERDSGRYICRSIRRTKLADATSTKKTVKRKVASKNMNDQMSFKIFVPGEMKFIHEHISQRKEDNNSNTSPIVIHHNAAVDGKEISLPCGVSDPTTQVTLYHMVGTNYLVEMPSNDGLLVHDNVDGFRIPVELVKQWSKINFICKAHQGGKMIREISFKIKLLNAWVSHISPPYSQVILHPGQLPIQVFKCEGEEPLVLKWLAGSTTTGTARVSSKVPTAVAGTQLYSVSFIATPTQFGNSSVARFECSRRRDGVVVHTWEWIKEEEGTNRYVRFDEKHKEFSCCLKNSEPRLLIETCSSMLECKLKASLQSRLASSSWNNIRRRSREIIRKGTQIVGPTTTSGNDNDNSCAVWKLTDEFQAGFFMCTQVKNNSGSDHFRDVELLPPVYLRWNDDVVSIRDGHVSKPLDDLIRMEMTTGTDTMEGDKPLNHKKIECFANSMVFARGFRWKIFTQRGEVFQNVHLKTLWGQKYGGIGVISYQEKYLPQESMYHGVLLIRTTSYVMPFLKINSKEADQLARLELVDKIKRIQCEAPLWNDTSIWISSYYNKSLLA